MIDINPEDLAGVTSFEALARLFYDKLGWAKPTWDTFEGVTELYGIPTDANVKSIQAVQRLSDDQSWGIFLVDFGAAELRRSQLRSILNKVAEKERQLHAERTWAHDRILFVCRSKQGDSKETS